MTIKRHSPWGDILHEVVAHNGTLYFGGIVADDTSLDMTGQAKDVFGQLDLLLAANGSDKEHILSVLIFLADARERDAFNAVWKEYFAPAHLPARAGIGASLGAGVKVEIVVTAAVIA